MARNHEKAQAMLNRWQRIKHDMEKDKEVRPWHTSECKTLSAAQRWRQEVIKEVARGVSEIQNASLGEYRIRELNDQINKLLREKGHWERRIIELGGPDYIAQAKKDALLNAAEAQGSMGYKYFGAAKDLPGVRELFEKGAAGPAKRTRYEMHRGVTPDYYGYRDDDDGVLERYERKAEARIRKKVIAEWHAQQAAKLAATTARDPTLGPLEITTEEEQAGFSSLVKVPTQAQMAGQLLEMRKQRLRAKLGLPSQLPPQSVVVPPVTGCTPPKEADTDGKDVVAPTPLPEAESTPPSPEPASAPQTADTGAPSDPTTEGAPEGASGGRPATQH
jgi:pre-mRNA-splicing factor ISY1